MKVLMVEDDPVARVVLQASLVALGYEVIAAPNGDAAWQLLAHDPIRVIVSDWDMPKMDGLELCRRVRDRQAEYVYFILLTNLSATDENQESALGAGVDDFLTKPVNPRELKMRLHVAERILGFTAHIEKLESFIPICSYCKKVRDDQSYWQQIETYINQRTGSEFSHSVCPDCYQSQIVPQLKALGITNIPPPRALGSKK
jgi:sigma-B regulation protein RsbU (phosphoserine phosphatase)